MSQIPGGKQGLSPDQLIVLASLIGLAILSWMYIAGLAADMPASPSQMPAMAGMPMGMAMDSMTGSGPPGFDTRAFALTSLMWFVMMLGMMIPSAAPMLLLYAHVQRRRSGVSPLVRTALFGSGYALVWGAFSLGAAGLQQVLAQTALVTPGLTLASRAIGGAVLIVAGVYELTPFKQVCLAHCRGPVAFIASHWRSGALGAIRMGIAHGLFCLGCCWALMLLLFVGGVMNLLWIAALAGLVLVQKLLPGGRVLAWLAGLVLIGAGAVLLWERFGPWLSKAGSFIR